MIAEPTFVDTNVLVSAYDADAGETHDAAKGWLRRLWEEESGLMSSQVLQEFYVAVTRTLGRPMPKRSAREVVATYQAWPVHRPGVDDIVAAAELEDRHRLTFRDALIVVSARRSGARALLTEGLQEGQRFFDNEVVVVNPFA